MFSEIPRCVVEASWAAWLASRKEHATVVTEKDEMQRDTKRVCLFTEEELQQPSAAQKKQAPAEGVSFF